MTVISKRDNKWHRCFAWGPVEVQSGYGKYETVIFQNVLRKYNRNLAAIGRGPYVYATEATRKFMNIKNEDIAS